MIIAFIPTEKKTGLHWYYSRALKEFILRKDGNIVAILKPKKTMHSK